MPLSLALREGDEFSVGSYRFSVVKIYSETHVQLRLPAGTLVDIDDERAQELAPDVFVMTGSRGQLSLCRIAVEAPRSMKIERHHQAAPARGTRSWRAR